MNAFSFRTSPFNAFLWCWHWLHVSDNVWFTYRQFHPVLTAGELLVHMDCPLSDSVYDPPSSARSSLHAHTFYFYLHPHGNKHLVLSYVGYVNIYLESCLCPCDAILALFWYQLLRGIFGQSMTSAYWVYCGIWRKCGHSEALYIWPIIHLIYWLLQRFSVKANQRQTLVLSSNLVFIFVSCKLFINWLKQLIIWYPTIQHKQQDRVS